MRPLRWMGAALAAGLLLMTATGAFAGDRRHEAWDWSGALRSGETVEVYGVNGAIVARPGSGGTVKVHADKSGRRDDPADVKIEVVKWDGGVTICAVYPGYGNACEAHDSHSSVHHNDVEVEFALEVPAGVALKAHTVNGGVDVKGLSGSVHASTVNGSCSIETSDTGEASTVNGSVTATLGVVNARDALQFKTVNGSITLNLPEHLDADVEGSTVNGGIDTDFPLMVSGHFGPRTLHGTVGRGGAKLNLSTVNGGIRLHRASSQSQ